MSTLKPKHWLFLVPDVTSSTSILYAPVHKFAVRVSNKAKEVLAPILEGEPVDGDSTATEMVEFLEKYGLLKLPESWYPEVVKKLKPNHKITMSLTNKCNLRCIYCYAETGTDFSTIPWEIAKDAIDSLVAETLEYCDDRFSITFHGGGESFVEFKLLRRCVEYARQQAQSHNLHVRFSTVTNATLITQEIAVWMKDVGFTNLTVSLDGVQDVNDCQRPKASGKGSFGDVMMGIQNISRAGLKFSLRSTVTDLGVGRMAEFVEFVAREIFPKGGTIHFEPMSLCGRATGISLTTDPTSFMKNYTLAKEKGGDFGVDITCSLDTFKQEKKRFCGANYCTMFCVSPNGMVSACSRVTKSSDVGSDLFFYATHDPTTQSFIEDEGRKAQILEHGSLPEKCKLCFARWNCQGDCPIARYAYEKHHEQSCVVITELLRRSLTKELDQESSKGGNYED